MSVIRPVTVLSHKPNVLLSSCKHECTVIESMNTCSSGVLHTSELRLQERNSRDDEMMLCHCDVASQRDSNCLFSCFHIEAANQVK